MDIKEKAPMGIYIFEGIDHVGKITIIEKLKEEIVKTTKYECANIAFPGNVPRTLGSLVYDIHHYQHKYFDIPINETSLQLLHIAAHIDLIEHNIIKNLRGSNSIVLLDRFWWSTYVYGLAGGLKKKTIKTILAPELRYWKDLNIKQIFLLEREERERDYEMEKETVILKKYKELVENEPNGRIIDNNGSIEETVTKIYNIILGE